MYRHVNGPGIELEAKLGLHVDEAGIRLGWPLNSECIIHSAGFHRFKSEVDGSTFSRINHFLNTRVAASRAASAAATAASTTSTTTANGVSTANQIPIQYTHTRERDLYFHIRGISPKVRVSVDTNTGKHLRAIVKERLENMDIYCPHLGFDFRISASKESEIQLDKLPNDVPEMERRKDRLSYRFDIWQFDITTVTTFDRLDSKCQPIDAGVTTFEIEMELADIPRLLHERYLISTQQQSQFTDIAQMFLHNIFALIDAAGRPSHDQPGRPLSQHQGAGGGGAGEKSRKRARDNDPTPSWPF